MHWSSEASLETRVKVTRYLTVASHQGFELKGTNGVSRLAVIDRILVAERLNGATFDPPIPLIALDKMPKEKEVEEKIISGTTRMRYMKTTQECNISLTQMRKEDSLYKGQTVRTLVGTLLLETPRKKFVLRTEYLPGVGILNQDQQADGNFEFGLVLLDKENGSR